MAEVLNQCTARGRGEKRLARLLESFDDQQLLLGFTIDFIPGGREIDLLLLHEALGIYVVEVKAVPLSAIKSVSPNSWVMEGRDSSESPLRQAYAQFEGLRSYWDARMRSRLNPVCATACLPEITRYEWLRCFPADSYPASIAEGLIFQDDLLDSATLRERLAIAMTNPAIRSGRSPSKLNSSLLGDLKSLFVSTQRQEPGISDRQRLKSIEARINKELLQDFPPGGKAFAVFTGNPGTGKTFRLLSVGVSHAYSQQKVLFACFNKTLASDVRRLLSFNQKLTHSAHGVDVADAFQLAKRVFEINGFGMNGSNSPDEWGQMVVGEMKRKSGDMILDRYDTILVDEAHDLMDWQLELIRLHAQPGATICIAVGKGQELYRDDSSALSWLEELSSGQQINRFALRRNFRNTKAQYFAALAFHQAWPDKLDKVQAAHASVFDKTPKRTEELDFGRDGEPLTYVPLPALQGEFDDLGGGQAELIAAEYTRILQKEILELVAEGGNPVGLLVLVPSENCQQAACARAALHAIKSSEGSVGFIDYTDDELRRSTAMSHEVRLCTFHSSRGLEGERVVIFGLEQIEAFAASTKVKPENLAFIALSRGIFRTVLVVRTFFTTRVHTLLKRIVTTTSTT
jgi:hypothetical protein